VYSSAFCRIYNEFGWNVYPEVLAEQLWEWLTRRGASVRTGLDLGCGTGVLCGALSARGVAAAGIDLSEGMIALARERYPACRFTVADMTAYAPAETFDLVTCTGDALNHLFSLEDVERVFRNVYGYLAPGGYFVFDLLRETEIPEGEPFELPYSDAVRAVFQTDRDGEEIVRLRVAVYENGEKTLEEEIREKVHDPETVCALLRRTGFTVLQCADRLLPEAGHGTTWFIAARKGPGQ